MNNLIRAVIVFNLLKLVCFGRLSHPGFNPNASLTLIVMGAFGHHNNVTIEQLAARGCFVSITQLTMSDYVRHCFRLHSLKRSQKDKHVNTQET